MAPGYAEKGLQWHEGLRMKVPLGEYREQDAKWKAREAEEDAQRRSSTARAATYSMRQSEFDDCRGGWPRRGRFGAPFEQRAATCSVQKRFPSSCLHPASQTRFDPTSA